MKFDLQLLPALTAIATLIAAGVAAVAAVTVAIVNAAAARRLARDTAHRAYRQAIVDPVLSFSRKQATQIGTLQAEILAMRDDESKRLKTSLANCMTQLAYSGTDRPLYVPDEGTMESVQLLVGTYVALAKSLLSTPERPTDEHLDLLLKHCIAMFRACASIELHAEAYVYGGSRRDAKARMKQTNRDLEEAANFRSELSK